MPLDWEISKSPVMPYWFLHLCLPLRSLIPFTSNWHSWRWTQQMLIHRLASEAGTEAGVIASLPIPFGRGWCHCSSPILPSCAGSMSRSPPSLTIISLLDKASKRGASKIQIPLRAGQADMSLRQQREIRMEETRFGRMFSNSVYLLLSCPDLAPQQQNHENTMFQKTWIHLTHLTQAGILLMTHVLLGACESPFFLPWSLETCSCTELFPVRFCPFLDLVVFTFPRVPVAFVRSPLSCRVLFFRGHGHSWHCSARPFFGAFFGLWGCLALWRVLTRDWNKRVSEDEGS